MPADPATLFFVLVITSATGTLLLTWCWLQNSAERTLLWTAAAYAGVAIGSFLFAGRGIIPDRLSIDAANAFSMLGMALAWAAGRAFNGRPILPWVPAIGPLLWVLACQLPAFYASFPARVMLSSTILAIYAVLTAREFAQRDGLLGRVPVVAMFVVHAVFVALRIPLTLTTVDDLPGVYQAAWFGMAALEAIVFSQVIAVLMVSLTKERVEKRLNAAALTDALTGLANRRALLERGAEAVAEAARRGRPIAVVAFDLDRFKEINDRFGHPVGDAVLVAFAAAAVATLRPGDIAGRLGGEEFAVVLPDASAADAAAVAERLMTAFRQASAAVEGCGEGCTTSAGVAASPAGRLGIEQLLSAADRALYAAKREGGDRVRFEAVAEVA
ncbi:GGDEF domain-containing protein [Pseudoxanthobacter sp. M-2]|uniref:GGDEF domain-containing protein n=1 Tax=Pseudoxanthobacter sp. M-2 TaxID=3078754 RepID=UPI0038FCCA84